jgi:hypothetical protein
MYLNINKRKYTKLYVIKYNSMRKLQIYMLKHTKYQRKGS